jgi:nitroreductase
MSAPSLEQLRFLLESGILAPSADNHHPLRFEVDEAGVNVWYSGGDLPAAGGYKRVLALLSLGAVSENITVAASRYGLRGEPVLFPTPDKPGLAFRAVWERSDAEDRLLWEEIPRRHTNRNIRYRGPGLSAEERARLERATETLPGCSLTWLDEPRARRQALALMRLAEGERFRNRTLHEELFSAIRFDVGWRHGCEQGLPPGALAIEPPLRPAFALLRHWPVMRVVNLIGGYRLLGWRAADLPCRFAPHLAAITVREVGDGSVFAAGRALQRLWLEATRLGMVLQPMAASALYALEGAKHEGIPDTLQNRLQQTWSALLPGRTPVMIFRMGRAKESPINAGRPRPVVA